MEYLIGFGIVGALLALWALHRFLLWCEARGWIYYLRKQGGGSGVGNALLEAQSLFEPDRRPTIEAMQAEQKDSQQSAAPDDPEKKEKQET
jgi:hypothetical protein